MAKNGKIDLCSANHRICNIRYVLIKFSGYIAYDMQFNFYPRPVMAFGYCRCLRLSVCVYVSVNHEFVRAITHHPFQLRSPNLDHRCKRPWLRSLFKYGGDWPWPSRSNLTSKSKFTPFRACPRNYSSPVQARATKFGPEVLNTLVKIPVVLGVDWAWHVKFNLFSKSCLFASLCVFEIFVIPAKKRMKRSLFHILNSYAHICSPTGTCHGPWNSRVVSLVWPLLASQSSTRRLNWQWIFACCCRILLNYIYLTCRNFVCQHSVMVETTLKPRAFVFIVSSF